MVAFKKIKACINSDDLNLLSFNTMFDFLEHLPYYGPNSERPVKEFEFGMSHTKLHTEYMRLHPDMVQPSTHAVLPLEILSYQSTLTLTGADMDNILTAATRFDPNERRAPVLSVAEDRVVLREDERPQTTTQPCHWDICLSNTTALSVAALNNSGKIRISLQDMALAALLGRIHSGEMSVNLSGEMDALAAIALRTTSGTMQAMLNGEFAKLAEFVLDVTSGNISTQLSGDYPALHTLTVHSTNGRLNMTLNGSYASGLHVEIESTTGDCALDLRGSFAPDTSITLNNVSGHVTVYLPAETGVAVRTSQLVGALNAPGLVKRGSIRLNQPALHHEPHITLNVNTNSGNITFS